MIAFRWRCRDSVEFEPRVDGVELRSDGRAPVLLRLPSRLARAAGALQQDLSDAAIAGVAGDDIALSAELFALRSQLQQHHLLAIDCYRDGRRLAELLPHAPAFDPAGRPARDAPRSAPWVLSRFALLRRHGHRLVLECPGALCDVVLHDPALAGWLHGAAAGASPATRSAQGEVLALLETLGFAETAKRAEPAHRKMWEFHDRLFHDRSRAWSDSRRRGVTYRFRERRGDGSDAAVSAPPAIRPPCTGQTIGLPVPVAAGGRPLRDVMESRRSRYEMGAAPVDLEHVAALLFRVARTTARLPNERLLRPYPSSGAIHELEVYLAVGSCSGLAAGFYHYRGDVHALTHLAGDDADRAAGAMLADCALAWGRAEEPPQCLAVISSRLPRLAWKYEGIAYRLSMLNAGALLGSLYLVATDLGLNGAAAGSGNPEHFALATGESSWAETSIAEFGFGSRPDTESPDGNGSAQEFPAPSGR